MMSFRTECTIFLKVPEEIKARHRGRGNKGEVDSASILEKKEATRTYWESKMLATTDDGGWEPVANVKFQADPHSNGVEDPSNPLPPPPEFSANQNNQYEMLSSAEEMKSEPATIIEGNARPARQYVYGSDEELKTKNHSLNVLRKSLNKPSSQENVIEAEIRQQQLREEALRRENDIRCRDKTGGASSPSSHASDEGFVERPIEEMSSSPVNSSTLSQGFTHTLRGSDGEQVIYDAVCPPSEFFNEKGQLPNGSTSETKIALEIRELKEREAELRALRELREKEQQVMRDGIPRNHVTEDIEDDDVEEEVERASSSSREILDDHLTSLTTTTDEGNFSEYGDPASSEDKSSDGSNSRIMSPDLQHSYGNHPETTRQRKITVKPFEEDESEIQPVYTQMKKESVIEREIKLAKEREEAFRREKGLLVSSSTTDSSSRGYPTSLSKSASVSNSLDLSNATINSFQVNGWDNSSKNGNDVFAHSKNFGESSSKATEEAPKRGVQHRMATSRIQQEIEETARRERELRSGGQIRTLSEDTVDSKVTRLSDMASEQMNNKPESFQRHCPTSSVSSSTSMSSLVSSSSRGSVNNTHPPLTKKTSSPYSTVSPYTPLSYPSSSNMGLMSSTRLTRSLSTNNLSMMSSSHNGALRPPQRGLMQKFIASRGKMTGSAFGASNSNTLPSPTIKPLSITSNGIPTRPMRVLPKASVTRREVETKMEEQEPTAKLYKRTHATAEEKIQEELKEMKQREEELRRLQARNLARSQPNLAGFGDDGDEEGNLSTEGVDSSSFLHEVNGLRSALSNPNLLEEENEQPTQVNKRPAVAEKAVRRRSALIAQWEGRIQQRTET